MIKNRIHYWSCSKFADWIRGSKKPTALTIEEWDVWKKENKAKRPFRFWLSDTFLTKLQNFFCFPKDIYNEFRHYYENRFVSKTHYLKTGLEPGSYHELDTRIMYGLFNELVEFVEGEQAWLNHISHKEKKFKFKNGKCPEAGLDYLDWAMSLKYDSSYGMTKKDKDFGKPTPQAVAAKKTLELYKWWKEVRPNRPDPMETSGWSDYCSNKGDYTKRKSNSMLKKLTKIEESYNKEDEDMMIELIKIRKSLWT
jgi:hypothetical protein